MTSRVDVTFPGDDGIALAAWLYLPDPTGVPRAAISMAHGYAGIREHGLAPFAEAFANAGFIVLVHDHRNFGASGGVPRGDIDPWRQIEDWRRAITYLASRPDVDQDRIGVWGSSYAGGHALVLGATDTRVACVVAQVPTISGPIQGERRISPDALPAFLEVLDTDERAQLEGHPPQRHAVVSSDPSVLAAYRAPDAIAFYLQPLADTAEWDNSVTLRSTRRARMYEPGLWAPRVSPTPLLMVVATQDTVTMTDLALTAYERALEPKKLVMVKGGHFDPYIARFDAASTAATEWFKAHLGAGKAVQTP